VAVGTTEQVGSGLQSKAVGASDPLQLPAFCLPHGGCQITGYRRRLLTTRTYLVNLRAANPIFGPLLAFFLVYFCSTAFGEQALNERTISAVRNCKEHFRIFIDVGHYKEAPGATSARGKSEFDFNLHLAQTLQKTLAARGYRQIRLFVSNGGPQSLQIRPKESAKFKADAFISIHHDDVQSQYKSTWTYNSENRLFSDDFKGYSLFISKANSAWPQSLQLATMISDEFLRRGMVFTKHHAEQIAGEGRKLLDEERGVYQYDELIVLKNNVAPAVLIEAGVIVNREEELILGSRTRRDLFSDAVSGAMEKFCVQKTIGDSS
jgi:N-acetylmuramoyl-L-alanine amidase